MVFLCRFIVEVVEEGEEGTPGVRDTTAASPAASGGVVVPETLEARDVQYVTLPDGQAALQINIDGETTLMVPCDDV